MAQITFQKSNVVADWDDSHESILELAEENGLDLDFGCRMGNCTACQQKLVEGSVDYPHGHSGEPDEGSILLCCSVPESDCVIDA